MIGRPPDKTKKIIKLCKQCGDLFESYISNNRTFCSSKCSEEYHAGENNVMKKEENKAKIRKSWKDPVKRDQHIKGMKESWKDPIRLENMSQKQLKRYGDPLEHKKRRYEQLKRFEDPLEHEKSRLVALKVHEDPLVREKIGSYTRKRFEDPIEREKASAKSQGQSYPDEWTGFVDNSRSHLISASKCIHLNPWFEGCNQHHIMTGVVINMPADLHRSIWHQMPNDDKKIKI